MHRQKRISYAAPDTKIEMTRTTKWKKGTPEPEEKRGSPMHIQSLFMIVSRLHGEFQMVSRVQTRKH